MSVLEVLQIEEEDRAWFQAALYRRAATCFEQAAQEEGRPAEERQGLWSQAAACWADGGDPGRAAALYRRVGDHARAGKLLLALERWEEGAACCRAWLEGRPAADVVGGVRARLGLAACLWGMARAAQERGERGAWAEARRAAREVYRAAREYIEAEVERAPLAAGRCWEALGAYGATIGRHDLVQVGYEMALRRYGAELNGERVRAAEAYLAAVEGDNRLLGAEIAARLAEWAPPAEERAWEALRRQIEGLGFRDGVRDVLHFVDEEAQLGAWQALAEMRGDPDQGAIDAYLAGLAPAGTAYVPAGPCVMGSAEDDPDADDDEKPQHEVTLAGYYRGRYPVTNGDYGAFIAAGGYETRAYWTEAGWARKEREGWRAPRYWEDEDYNQPRQPVVGVSWYEAAAYCRWRGGRLPSEAEWEKAAGWDPAAGHKRRYPWGDEWEEEQCDIDQRQRGYAALVGAHSPGGDSAYGCGDMAGNVWEWCSTRWRDEAGQAYGYPYHAEDGREALSGGDEVWRVYRSSSWWNEGDARRARCAYRGGYYPWARLSGRGFRIAFPRRLLFLGAGF